MVSLINSMPLFCDSLGELSSLDMEWLRRAISAAAIEAGYHGWWLTDDLVSGISNYLQSDYDGCAINRRQLEQVVRRLLRGVGYGEVATFFRAKLPCLQISLSKLVNDLRHDDSAGFFDALTARITSLRDTKATHIHFCDLQMCVDNLTALLMLSDNDAKHCLTADIVAFLREKILCLFQQQQLLISID